MMDVTIEEKVIQFLKGREGIPEAFPEVPQSPPGMYLVVFKSAGGYSETIRSGAVTVRSYAPTRQSASNLNEKVIEAMLAMISEDDVSMVVLNSDAPIFDTQKKQPRYQAVFEITYY